MKCVCDDATLFESSILDDANLSCNSIYWYQSLHDGSDMSIFKGDTLLFHNYFYMTANHLVDYNKKYLHKRSYNFCISHQIYFGHLLFFFNLGRKVTTQV